jgi:coenzyme PQQ biosynthesis protein PqqD
MAIPTQIPVTRQSRPKLAVKTRLRRDRHDGPVLLLSPERGLILNDSSREVLALCTGEASVATIIELLCARHPDGSADTIARDVLALFSDLQSRGLIEVA